MVDKNMKSCLTSLVIRKMQIKPPRYNLTATKMAMKEKLKGRKRGRKKGKKKKRKEINK